MAATEVYIITEGEYSDYRIIAVFSDEQAAQAFVDDYNEQAEFNRADIEEWPIDDRTRRGDKRIGHTVVMARDGTVLKCWSYGNATYYPKQSIWSIARCPIGPARPEVHGDTAATLLELLGTNIYARDEQHAIKIANEKRAQLIAEGLWKVED